MPEHSRKGTNMPLENDAELNQNTESEMDDDALFDQIADEMEGRGAEDPEEGAADDLESSSDEEAEEEAEQEQDEQDQDKEGDDEQPGAAEEAAPTAQELQQQLERLTHQAKSDSGRIAAYQRQINEMKQQLSAKAESPATTEQPTAQDAVDAMESGEWDQFAQDFPEMAKAVESILEKRLGKTQEEMNSKFRVLDEIQAERRQEIGKSNYERAAQTLQTAHPDWMEVDQSEGFKSWLSEQPKHIQGMYGTQAEEDPEQAAENAVWLISQYKKDAAIPANPSDQHDPSSEADRLRQTRDKRLQRSVIPQTKKGAASLDSDSEDALWEEAARLADKQNIR